MYHNFVYNNHQYHIEHNAADRGRDLRVLVHEIFRHRTYITEHCNIRRGNVVLDGGANLGLFSLFAAACGASLIFAVEPNKESCVFLKRNMCANAPDTRLSTIEKALWDVACSDGDRLHLRAGKHAAGSRIVSSTTSHSYKVESTTIDSLGIEPDFIKLDTEGCEMRILRGAVNTIRRCRPRLSICLYHYPKDIEEIPAFVNSLGLGYRQEITPGVVLHGRAYPVGHWS